MAMIPSGQRAMARRLRISNRRPMITTCRMHPSSANGAVDDHVHVHVYCICMRPPRAHGREVSAARHRLLHSRLHAGRERLAGLDARPGKQRERARGPSKSNPVPWTRGASEMHVTASSMLPSQCAGKAWAGAATRECIGSGGGASPQGGGYVVIGGLTRARRCNMAVGNGWRDGRVVSSVE